MSWKDIGAFSQNVFDGKDRDGNRFGVYVTEDVKKWEFKLIGNLITPNVNDVFYPLRDGEKEDIMDIPEKGFFDRKSNMRSKWQTQTAFDTGYINLHTFLLFQTSAEVLRAGQPDI